MPDTSNLVRFAWCLLKIACVPHWAYAFVDPWLCDVVTINSLTQGSFIRLHHTMHFIVVDFSRSFHGTVLLDASILLGSQRPNVITIHWRITQIMTTRSSNNHHNTSNKGIRNKCNGACTVFKMLKKAQGTLHTYLPRGWVVGLPASNTVYDCDFCNPFCWYLFVHFMLCLWLCLMLDFFCECSDPDCYRWTCLLRVVLCVVFVATCIFTGFQVVRLWPMQW